MVFFPSIIIYNMVNVYKNAQLLTDYEALRRYKNINKHEILSEIDNPGPLYLVYNYAMMKSMLYMGTRTKNNIILEEVVEMSKYFVQHTPIISVFEIIAMALKALGKKLTRLQLNSMRYLYPDLSEGTEWLHAKVDYPEQEKLGEESLNRLREAELFLEKNKKTILILLRQVQGFNIKL